MMASNSALENGSPLILEPACKESEEIKENDNNDGRVKHVEDKEVPKSHVLAFARVYSGTIKRGQRLYVLGPKHDPREAPSQELAPLDGQDEALTNRYTVLRSAIFPPKMTILGVHSFGTILAIPILV